MPRPERPLGRGDEVLLEFAADLRRLRHKAGSPTYRDLGRQAHYSAATLSEAAGGRKLPTLAVTVAYVRACGGDVVEWEQRWHAVAAELAHAEASATASGEQPSPYVGLAAFRIEDADRFCGRERLVEELLARVAQRRFLAVFGASGAGKSSLLHAGLVAKVRAGGLATGPECSTVVFTPGRHPWEECAIQLAAMTDRTPGQVHADLMADPRNLHRGIRQILDGQPSDRELVLVVDQFEEVFTLCQDPQERTRFITGLVTAAQAANSRTRVVLGVRADFYTHCSDYPDLVTALSDAQVLVGPMTAEELRRAITQPAVRADCAVEGALLAQIVADAAGQPGALPLISHALLETWRRRRGNTLTLAGYQATGGIRGALAHTAETLYTTLTPTQQRLAQDLFLRLTALGEGTEDTKRRIVRTELDIDDPDIDTVLHILAEARLVTLGDSTVEVAHEALIGAWPRLHQWLTADREGLRTHRQLTDATHTWTSLNHDPGALYRGARLALAREWANREGQRDQLNPAERAFLDASTAAELAEQRTSARRQRHLRYLTLGLAILLLVATAVGVVAVGQRQDAVQARQVAISRQLAAQALALADSRPGTAMLLSVEAFRSAPTTEARGALLSMSAHQAYQTELTGQTEPISEVTFSPDGRILATAGRDKTVVLWDTQRRARLATLTGHATWLRTLTFSPDGRMVATGGDDQTVMLWDAATGARLATLTGHTELINDLAFSPDGRTLATASSDQTIMLWDVAQRTRLATLTGHTGFVQTVTFSPDGRTLATGSADHTIMLWDTATGTRPATLTGHTRSADAVAFSPDGRTLASASPDQTVMLWDVARRTRLTTLTGHTGAARAVAFSPDGRTLATAGHDHMVILWDTAHHTRLATLAGHPDNIYTLAFHPRIPLLASAGENGTVILWNPARLPLSGHSDWLNDVAFTPDGRTLASASTDGTAMLWDTESRTQMATLAGKTGPVNAVAFSPDGRTVATATGSDQHPPRAQDYTLTLWDATDRASPVTLTGHTNRVQDVAFSPDGRTLATASIDGTVILWDAAHRTRLATLTHTDGLYGVAFSPDGRTLASAGHDHTVVLWDVAQRTRLATLTGHTGSLREVAFSPDGRTLATASIDRTVILWDVARHTRLAVLAGHAGAVNTLAFSPDGRTLATGSSDRTVTLWDVAQHSRLATLTGGHTEQIRAVAFSSDGRTLASASADKTVILWDADPQHTTKHICDTLARNLTPDEWTQSIPETPYHETCTTT